MANARTTLDHYHVSELPDDDQDWIERTALTNPSIEALAKPLKERLLTDLYVLRQPRRNGQLRRVAVAGTRRLSLLNGQLAQTPLYDSGQAAHDSIFKLRSIQLAHAQHRAGEECLESYTSEKSRGDTKAHLALSFDQRSEIRAEEYGDYVEMTQGWRFIPWLRPPCAAVVFDQKTLADRLKRMADDLYAILNGLKVERSQVWQISRPKDGETP